MNRVCPFRVCCLLFLMAIATRCFPNSRKTEPPEQPQKAAAPTYQVDPLAAGSVSGMIRYIGKRPLPKKIDMSGDLACVEAHHGNELDESLVVSSKGGLANAFVYAKSGLEGETFATPRRRLRLIRMGAGSGRVFLVFRRTRLCRLRTPIRSRTAFTPWRRSTGNGTIVRERENRRLPEVSPGRSS